MSQHDFSIANQTASSARSDINNALQALATNNSGNTAPSTTYANMWWYENDTNLLKIRNEADNGWINVAYLDGSNWQILDDTKVVNTSGVQTGLLGDQTQATWTTGTGTTESLVSPAKIKAAIDTLGGTFSSSNGSFNHPSGFQVRFGSFQSNLDSDQTVTFPVAFSTAALAGVVGAQGLVESPTSTNFIFDRDNGYSGTITFYYIFVGH